MPVQGMPTQSQVSDEARPEVLTQASDASPRSGLDWTGLIASAHTPQSYVNILEKLGKLSTKALRSLLLCDSVCHHEILVIVSWWPYLSQSKDKLLLIRVLQRAAVTAEDLKETGLPHLVEALLLDIPDHVQRRVLQLLSGWRRLLRQAERYRFVTCCCL